MDIMKIIAGDLEWQNTKRLREQLAQQDLGNILILVLAISLVVLGTLLIILKFRKRK